MELEKELIDKLLADYQLTASTLIAELGVQMQQFPDAMHLASWAGLCPGDCESAGKRKNTRTRDLRRFGALLNNGSPLREFRRMTGLKAAVAA